MKHISFISSNVTTKTSSSLSLFFFFVFFFGHVYSKKWRKLISYLNSRSKPILSPYVAMQYINLSNIHINCDRANRILRKKIKIIPKFVNSPPGQGLPEIRVLGPVSYLPTIVDLATVSKLRDHNRRNNFEQDGVENHAWSARGSNKR